jgi:hypothetical protein
MDEQVGGRAILKDVRENLPQLRDAMRQLPAILQRLGEQAENGRVDVNLRSVELAQLREQIVLQRRQRYWLAIAATGAVTGTLVLSLAGLPLLGWPLLGISAVAAVAARP